MITQLTHFRYEGDDTPRAIVNGDITKMDPLSMVLVKFTAGQLVNSVFKWRLIDLIKRYDSWEVITTEPVFKKYLDVGYVYAPYIPLQTSELLK